MRRIMRRAGPVKISKVSVTAVKGGGGCHVVGGFEAASPSQPEPASQCRTVAAWLGETQMLELCYSTRHDIMMITCRTQAR